MTGLHPTERRFEEHIDKNLLSVGYSSRKSSEYDRTLCLIQSDVVEFIRTTQPKKWNHLEEIYGTDVEKNFLARTSTEIAKRGIIDVLRNQVVDRGVYIDLCYFKPKSDMNPDHQNLYQSNRFTMVRQLHYSKRNENSIDMVLFLNGLPLITIELKNQLTGQNIFHSQNQYRDHRDPNEPLLKFKRCAVHFCIDNDRVSMTTRLAGEKTAFLPYNRDLENPRVENGYRTQYMWEEILTPDSLLDILENFVHISKEKRLSFNSITQNTEPKTSEVLIFPRYHQLELVRKFQQQIRIDGVGTNYLVQHTTGSGKSYSIGWLAHTLTSLYRSAGDKKRMFDTIVVVTDRTVLDDQLRHTLRSLEKVEGVVSAADKSSQQLQKFLEQSKEIIVTTIHKFPIISKTTAALSDKTFAVIIDEVHSSQSGEMAKELKRTLSKTVLDQIAENDGELDYEDMLRLEIKFRGKQDHISFFGFTGTPKEKTLEIFGTKSGDQFTPFHIYSMYQSIHEGFTLDVLRNYTTYKRFFLLNQVNDRNLAVPVSEGTKRLLQYVDSHELTIRNKVSIMLDHWINKGSKEIQGKSRGMIVTQSRQLCVKYFFEINKQLEERGINHRALVGFSGEVKVDGESYSEQSLNNDLGHKGNVPLGLKNPKFRLLIAAFKFQTGFDEPLLQCMYVDKKLNSIHCVQTLSRLNRTMPGKTQTFVLDFVNKPDEVRNSFQRFFESTILEGETDPNRLYDIQREIYDFNLYTKEDVNRFCKAFYVPSRDDGILHSILDLVVDKFKQIVDPEQREDFRSKLQSFVRIYGYLSQIITFTDSELEKSYLYFKYLERKLPRRDKESFDISDTVELDSLRIQKIHEKVGELVNKEGIVQPHSLEHGPATEPEFDSLSEIINRINHKYGLNLTDEHKVYLASVEKSLNNNEEAQKIMNGDNSEENIRIFMRKAYNDELLKFVSSNFEFYKKLVDEPSINDLIFKTMYENCRKQNSELLLK